MSVLAWITAIASLVGVWLNIRRHVACFWIWTGTNVIWTVIDLQAGIYAQATLQAVYVGLALYGLWSWSQDPPEGTGTA